MIAIRNYCLIFALIISFILVLSSMTAPLFQEYRIYRLSALLYQFERNICHQLPTRCIWLFNRPMGLCARCFGIYTGIFLFTLLILSYNFYIKTIWILLLIIPISIDIGAKTWGWHGTRLTSFFTGILGAISIERFFIFLMMQLTGKKGGDRLIYK